MGWPDWNLDDVSLAGLHFAEWLDINDGRAESFVDEYRTDHERAWKAAEAHGWVETVVPEGKTSARLASKMPQAKPSLTLEGLLKVREVQGLRKNRLARVGACRQAILFWLADVGRGAVSLSLLVEQDAFHFYGTPFTTDEANDAGKFLYETGLISGITSFGPGLTRPELTVRGQQCVEFYGGDVRDFLNPAQPGGPVTNQQNFYGDVNGQVGQGQNVTQTQTNGIDAEALSAIFRAMREALSTVEDPHDREDVEHGIQQLEAAVQTGDAEEVTASAGRLQRLGARVGTTASNTAITVATTEGVKQLLGALGLG